MEEAQQAATRINAYFRTTLSMEQLEGMVPRWASLLNDFPLTNMFWLTRGNGGLLYDLFGLGAINALTDGQRRRLLFALSARVVDLAVYTSTSFVGPATRAGVWDRCALMAVREQVTVLNLPKAGSPHGSALLRKYHRVAANGSWEVKEAINLLARVDVGLRQHLTGTVLLGPSTVDHAGLGAIAVGLNDPPFRFEYYGHLYAPGIEPPPGRHLANSLDGVVDGSVVASVASVMNAPPPGTPASNILSLVADKDGLWLPYYQALEAGEVYGWGGDVQDFDEDYLGLVYADA